MIELRPWGTSNIYVIHGLSSPTSRKWYISKVCSLVIRGFGPKITSFGIHGLKFFRIVRPLGSISPKFYEQLIDHFLFTQKKLTLIVSTKKLCISLFHTKDVRKMLIKWHLHLRRMPSCVIWEKCRALPSKVVITQRRFVSVHVLLVAGEMLPVVEVEGVVLVTVWSTGQPEVNKSTELNR